MSKLVVILLTDKCGIPIWDTFISGTVDTERGKEKEVRGFGVGKVFCCGKRREWKH